MKAAPALAFAQIYRIARGRGACKAATLPGTCKPELAKAFQPELAKAFQRHLVS